MVHIHIRNQMMILGERRSLCDEILANDEWDLPDDQSWISVRDLEEHSHLVNCGECLAVAAAMALQDDARPLPDVKFYSVTSSNKPLTVTVRVIK
jgi:hypothetical protein